MQPPFVARREFMEDTAISIQAISWVLEHSRSRLGPRHVLISIANHADRLGNNAYPSLETIGLEARLTSRQVARALPLLVALGELEIFHAAGQKGRGGTTNRYLLPLMGKQESPKNLSPLPKREEGEKSPSRGDISGPEMSYEPSGTEKEPSKASPPTPPGADSSRRGDDQTSSLPPLPDWIPARAWQHYLEMREQIRKPMTPRAIILAVRELGNLASRGNNPEEVLNQSILNSWSGLYEVKNGRQSWAQQRQQRSLEAIGQALQRANSKVDRDSPGALPDRN